MIIQLCHIFFLQIVYTRIIFAFQFFSILTTLICQYPVKICELLAGYIFMLHTDVHINQ